MNEDDPTLRRLTELEQARTPEDRRTGNGAVAHMSGQIRIAMDEMMAQVLRNVREGKGKTLKQQGLTATAGELRNWRVVKR